MIAYRKVPEDLLAETLRVLETFWNAPRSVSYEQDISIIIRSFDLRRAKAALAGLQSLPIHEGDGVPEHPRPIILGRYTIDQLLLGEQVDCGDVVFIPASDIANENRVSPRPEPRKEAESATPVQDKPCGTCGGSGGEKDDKGEFTGPCDECNGTGRASSPTSAGEPDACPVCGGDCAGANPPVVNCPMMAALTPAVADDAVERGAKTIWDTLGGVTPWWSLNEDTKEKYRRAYRAALSTSKTAATQVETLREALNEIASSHYGKCPFDRRDYDPGGPLIPCPVCGDIDDLGLPESDPRKGKPSHCHQGGASCRARAALSSTQEPASGETP